MKLFQGLLISIVVTFFVTACGGGGSDSGSDGGGGSTADVPQFEYAGFNSDTSGKGSWTDAVADTPAQLNWAENGGQFVMEIDLASESRPYTLTVFLSADDALDEGDTDVIGVGCNAGINSACLNFIFWQCTVNESPRVFSDCYDSETGKDLPESNIHSYQDFVDTHGAGAQVWMIWEACTPVSNGSGGFENACSDVALPVTIY